MRTLVLSDLHLGARGERDLLRDPANQGPLLEQLAEVDRLVLLGDVVELRQGPIRDALAVASRVLASVAEALGPGSEVVIVPGNHDHQLLAEWFDRRAGEPAGSPLELDSTVDWLPGEPLARLAAALAPAQVRASYPGVWLRDDVYATHGHYCDRHTTLPMFERLAAGAMARVLGRPLGEIRGAEDYEAVLQPIYAWIHAVAQTGGPEMGRSSHGASTSVWQSIGRSARRGRVRRQAVNLGVAAGIGALNRAGVGPLKRELSGSELRRAALLAFGEVLTTLRINSAYAIFGHTHRAGPLPPDEEHEWRAPNGARLLNTGCWVHEPAFLGPRPDESPYRAGFCVRIDDDRPPALINLWPGPA